MKFTYHPDEHIYINSKYSGTYNEFMATRSDFPLVRGRWFDYVDGIYHEIDSNGHNLPAIAPKELIASINSL